MRLSSVFLLVVSVSLLLEVTDVQSAGHRKKKDKHKKPKSTRKARREPKARGMFPLNPWKPLRGQCRRLPLRLERNCFPLGCWVWLHDQVYENVCVAVR